MTVQCYSTRRFGNLVTGDTSERDRGHRQQPIRRNKERHEDSGSQRRHRHLPARCPSTPWRIGYTLTAADSRLGGATSGGFNITPAAADHLAFSVQPSSAVAGVAIKPAVTVQVLDQFNNLLTGDTSNVTVAIGTNAGGSTLSGTTTVAASGGIATFSTLSINKTGTGYTLSASDSSLGSATSGTFDITPAAADHLGFGVQPTNTVAGVAISPAVTVRVLDQFGNLLTSDDIDKVTLSVASGPGGFASGSTTTVTVSSGVATFSNLVLDTAGSYTLGESGTGPITGPNSASFTVVPAAANHLAFGVQPSATTAGVAISPAVTVQVLDQFGNLVTGDTSNVTVAIGTNPSAGTLSGTKTVAASGGVATFSTLSIDKEGIGYTLTAADSRLGGAASGGFNITPAAADHLAFNVQPSSAVAGVAISPAVTVQVLDQFNNLLTGDNIDKVTLSVASGPGRLRQRQRHDGDGHAVWRGHVQQSCAGHGG